MKPLRLLDQAEAELMDAAFYYQEQVPGLGMDFLDSVDKAFDVIAESPERWPIVGGTIRKYPLARFPFGILYRVDPGEVLILAVAHSRRRPWYWKSRI